MEVKTIKTFKEIRYFGFIPLYLFTLIYLLFVYGNWWMFFCTFLCGAFTTAYSLIFFSNEPCTVFIHKKKFWNSRYADLQDYEKQHKKERFKFCLSIILVCLWIFLNLFPFLATFEGFIFILGGWNAYEGGIMVNLLTLIIILLVCIFSYYLLKEQYLQLKEQEKYIDSAHLANSRLSQKAVAAEVFYSQHNQVEENLHKPFGAKLIYICCSSYKQAEIIKKDWDRFTNGEVVCEISSPDPLNAKEESLISDADAVICFIDKIFINSLESNKKLIYALNLNKIIFPLLYGSDKTQANEILKRIRRESYSCEIRYEYNRLFKDISPILGISTPMGDCIGEKLSIIVKSENPFILEFDNMEFPFQAGLEFKLFFSRGQHILSFRLSDTLIVKKIVSVSEFSFEGDRKDQSLSFNFNALSNEEN